MLKSFSTGATGKAVHVGTHQLDTPFESACAFNSLKVHPFHKPLVSNVNFQMCTPTHRRPGQLAANDLTLPPKLGPDGQVEVPWIMQQVPEPQPESDMGPAPWAVPGAWPVEWLPPEKRAAVEAEAAAAAAAAAGAAGAAAAVGGEQPQLTQAAATAVAGEEVGVAEPAVPFGTPGGVVYR